MNTPDTEWEEGLQDVIESYIMVAEMGHFAVDQKEHKEDMRAHWENLKSYVRTLLSSRDTYWKERVEETRTALLFVGEKVLKEMSEIYAVDIKYADKKQWLEPSEFERIFLHRFNEAGLQTLDTLLDNLK